MYKWLFLVLLLGCLLAGYHFSARRANAQGVGARAMAQVHNDASADIPAPIRAMPGKAALNLYVAVNGNDAWSGKLSAPTAEGDDGPFATLEAARDAIRRVKAAGLPKGGVTVWLHGGSYFRANSFALTALDSGTADAPIAYCAVPDETVRLTGGKTVTGFAPVTDPAILTRLQPDAKSHVLCAELAKQGIDDFGHYVPQGGIFPPKPAALEVFFRDQPLTLARWPHAGNWATITGAPGGKNGATFSYAGDEPAKWGHEADIWLHGYWTWNWADSYVSVAFIDPVNHVITTNEPYGAYGYSVGGRFYAQNILEELDQPGEWYLQQASGRLYCWPPAPLSTGAVTVSLTSAPLVTMTGTSYVTLEGLIVECARGTGITITGGAHNRIADCIIRNVGNYAVDIEGGTHQGVSNCVITGTGDGGIILHGGDAAARTPGNLFADHNEIAHYSRWVSCYQPAIHVQGCGASITHNKIYDAPHNAILIDGSQHVVEYNEISRVCLQTQDAGACYTGGRDNATRDNTIRYNFFHDLGTNTADLPGGRYRATAAIYLDDGGSYVTVFGNIITRCNVGVLIGGGSENTVRNNIITGCPITVHVDGRNGPPHGIAITNNILRAGKFEFWNELDEGILTIKDNLTDADPHFIDPEHDNYQLPPDSPATALGFQALPLNQIGRK